MADILDAAQQQINAAAGGTPPAGDVPAPDPAGQSPLGGAKPADPVSPPTPPETPKTETPPAEPSKPTDDMPLPPEKPLVVPASGPAPAAQPNPAPAQEAPSAPVSETPVSQASVNINIGSTPPPEPPPPAPVAPSSSSPKKSGKGGSKMAVIAGVIMLLFALPTAVFFVSQRQQIADNRNRATGCGPAPCSVTCSNGQSFSDSCLPTFGSCDQWAKEACGTVNSDSGGGGNDGGGNNNNDACPGGQNPSYACLDVDTCVQYCGSTRTGEVGRTKCAGKGYCGLNDDGSSAKNPDEVKPGGGGGGGGGGGDDDDGNIVNPGTNDKSCNNNTGSCTAGGDQNLVVCYCSPDELVTEEEARAAGKYPEAVGSCPLCETKPGGSSASCKQEAKNSCKVVQLDIVSPNDPQKIIDTIVCNPPANCSTAQGGGGGGTTSDGGGGGRDKKKKLACQKLRIFKDGKKVDEKNWPKFKAGDAITFVIDHQEAKKARVRVNGAAWTETTKKKDGDFILDFTIPAGVTTFTIEAEVNKKGDQWK